jgi:hypothetical protein
VSKSYFDPRHFVCVALSLLFVTVVVDGTLGNFELGLLATQTKPKTTTTSTAGSENSA